MFDDIDYQCLCPLCGNEVSGFQSKDGPCVRRKLKPWEVSNFYTSCRKCEAWIEFVRSPNEPPPPEREPPPEPEGWIGKYAQRAEPAVKHRKYLFDEKLEEIK